MNSDRCRSRQARKFLPRRTRESHEGPQEQCRVALRAKRVGFVSPWPFVALASSSVVKNFSAAEAFASEFAHHTNNTHGSWGMFAA